MYLFGFGGLWVMVVWLGLFVVWLICGFVCDGFWGVVVRWGG